MPVRRQGPTQVAEALEDLLVMVAMQTEAIMAIEIVMCNIMCVNSGTMGSVPLLSARDGIVAGCVMSKVRKVSSTRH